MEVERKGIGEEESCHILNGVFSFIMKKLRNKIKKKTVLFPFALYKYLAQYLPESSMNISVELFNSYDTYVTLIRLKVIRVYDQQVKITRP